MLCPAQRVERSVELCWGHRCSAGKEQGFQLPFETERDAIFTGVPFTDASDTKHDRLGESQCLERKTQCGGQDDGRVLRFCRDTAGFLESRIQDFTGFGTVAAMWLCQQRTGVLGKVCVNSRGKLQAASRKLGDRSLVLPSTSRMRTAAWSCVF